MFILGGLVEGRLKTETTRKVFFTLKDLDVIIVYVSIFHSVSL